MRHRVAGRKLGRTISHRRALRRNLVQSLFEHGEVTTTVVKAREVRGFAERLITLALDGSLAARQRAEALLTDRAVIPKEHQKDYDKMSDARRAKTLRARSGRRHRMNKPRGGLKFTAESILHKLFADVGPAIKKRNETKGSSGGYTRIIKLADRRLGDAGELAILQLVKDSDKARTKRTSRTERKRRAGVKYAVYAGKPRTPRVRRKSEGPSASKAREAKPE
jgi:large subunit ribosomal protein L17